MGFLIDTSVFITMERKGKVLAELIPIVGEQGITVATISISELYEGVLRAESENRRNMRMRFVVGLMEHIPVARFELLDAIVMRTLRRFHAGLVLPLGQTT